VVAATVSYTDAFTFSKRGKLTSQSITVCIVAKQQLVVVQAHLSLAGLARSLRISEPDAIEKFQDPRVTSWFAEIWGETLFGYRRHASSNHPGSDAQLALGPIGRFDISVRCFNKGSIKFQKSKFIGFGRSASADDLIASVEEVERMVIVDLRQFPLLSFYPIDSKSVLRLIRLGELTKSGLTPRRFDAWIARDFNVVYKIIDLPIPEPPNTCSAC
jgi:hypothetical protein